MAEAETPGRRELRADGERNRQRILVAAREVLATEGLDASMRRIAKQAGVGEPTLRRRFGSKEALVAEAFEDAVTEYADAAEAALLDPDPWHAFQEFVRRITRLQLAGRGLAEVLTTSFPRSMRHEQERVRAYAGVQELLIRAKAAGGLRDDFVAEDIVLVLMAHAGVVTGGGNVAEALSARLLAFLLEGASAPGATPLPAAPTPAETYRALSRLHSAPKRSAFRVVDESGQSSLPSPE